MITDARLVEVRETARRILDQLDLDDDEGALALVDECAADWPDEDRRFLLHELGFVNGPVEDQQSG